MNSNSENKQNLIFLLFGFLFIVISSISFDYYVNKDRVISYEPDDIFSYLVPASNSKYCKTSDCYEGNFFKHRPSQDAEKWEIYGFERQIHRLIYDYTPLYTFILDKISTKKNIHEAQKIFHLFLSLISALAIFFYLKETTKPKVLLLIVIILGTHYCANNWGIKSPLAWTVSSFIGLLGILLQFKMRKFSLFLYFVAILFHQIGLVLLVMGYIVFLTYNFDSITNFKKINKFLKKELLFIFLYLIFIIIGLKFKYTPFDLNNINVATVYTIDYFNILNILISWKNNFLVFTNFFIKTVILLNPILFFFFLSAFFIKISDQFKIIKIFTIVFLLIVILFIHGVGEFAIGKRLWPIFVINYLILSIISMYYFSKKNIFINNVKIIYFVTLPFVILVNLSLHFHPLPWIVSGHNYQYDFKNISNFKKLVDKNKEDIIYFPIGEPTFYYFISAGFIQNNIYHKYQKLKETDLIQTKYLILDNPITIPRPSSDLLLKNNTKLTLDKKYEKFKLIIFSKDKTKFSINGKNYLINKGYNDLILSEKKINI